MYTFNMPSAERKWLKLYGNIPHNIEYPSMSITGLMYERANKYHNYLALKYTQGGLSHVEKFDEFAANIELTAKMLKANGVKQGDRVIILLPYLPESYHTVYAVFALGAVLVPLHPQETKNPARIAELIKDVAASFIVCLDTCVPDLEQLFSQDETVADFIQRVLYITPLDSLIKNAWKSRQNPAIISYISQFGSTSSDPAPESSKISPFAREIKAAKHFQGKITVDIKGDEDAAILFTSGTSGKKPDGCIHTHNAYNSAAMSAHEICFVDPGMKSIAVPGLFHCFGLNAATHAFLINGITQIVVPNPRDFKSLAETQKRERAEVHVNVPLMLTKMRDSGLFDDVPYDNAVLFLTGGNGMSARNLQYWGDKLPKGIGVTEGYGSTQTLSAGSINLPHKKKAKSIGVPYPDYFFKLIDSETNLEIAEPNKTGEIYIAGPSLLKGLLNDPDPECITVDANGIRWYKSRDLAYFDEEHFFFFVDRIDDVLSMNDGNLVNPLEIRNVLAQNGIEEPVIFRKTDAENEYDRIVVCIESSRGDEELEELRLALQKSFAAGLRGYEIPSEVVVLNNYPLSLAGKPLKKVISDLYDSGNYQKKLLIK
ncbi:MAG: acyl--CoA ligase [Clostridiales bacterium]|jgi:acyl-CoA synthetase (AMP-forming)/AMP-acid ligase II|nr:acyl--CoA ligase [Clostridiales bacterium]